VIKSKVIVTIKVEIVTVKVINITDASPRGAINSKIKVIKPLINAEATFLTRCFLREIVII